MSADDDIAQTLARAGTRPPLSARMSREVRERTEKAWREALASRVASRRRRRLLLAAASVLVATGLGLAIGWHVEQRAVTPVGIFLASLGSVDIRAPDDARLAVGGMTVAAGTRVHTGAAGQALLTIGEISVRIGPLSAVTLLRADRIQIDAGKIYLDFGAHETIAHDLHLITPFGQIEHLGTQFQADVGAGGMIVAVREGHVRLLTRRGEQLIGMGEAANVESSGATRVQPVMPSGASWAWTMALVPDFPIEGRTLAEFLDWYTRETGKRINYANLAMLSAAQRTRLSGSIAGLAPDSALKVILASTQFDCDLLENGELRLTMRNSAHAKLLRDGLDGAQTRLTTQD